MMIEEIINLFCQGAVFAVNIFLMWKKNNEQR